MGRCKTGCGSRDSRYQKKINATKANADRERTAQEISPSPLECQLRKLTRRRDQWDRQIAAVDRVITSRNTKMVLDELEEKFKEKSPWREFILAAVTAHQDFAHYRKARKSVSEAATKIAAAAKNLSKLLRKFDELDADQYSFSSVADLLFHTIEFNNLGKRCGLMGYRYPFSSDRENRRFRAALLPLPDLLDTLAEMALKNTGGIYDGAIRAAIESKKPKPTTEYLRAFCLKLLDDVLLSKQDLKDLSQTIATMASTVLNIKDVDELQVINAIKWLDEIPQDLRELLIELR